MSTLQHTRQPALRHRLWLIVAGIGATVALALVVVAINSGSSTQAGNATSAPSRQSDAWLSGVTDARSAIAHGEPAAVAPDVAAQRSTLAATSRAVAAQHPQPEPEALVDARFRHPVPAGGR